MHGFSGLRLRARIGCLAVLLIGAATTLAAAAGEAPTLEEYISTICTMSFRSAPPEEAPFLAENVPAMAKMMAGMEIKPSGDVDKDFVAMMVPHHQGAIGMAKAVLRYGHNQEIRRIAEAIIVQQEQEIAAMRGAVGAVPSSR